MHQDDQTKATIRIDNNLYQEVKKNFHYGQFSILFRYLFLSLSILIKQKKFRSVIEYLYEGKDLILPGITKDKKI